MKNDITRIYNIGIYKIYFDAKDWTWRAVNIWGFGVDSDGSLIKLKKRIRELIKK